MYKMFIYRTTPQMALLTIKMWLSPQNNKMYHKKKVNSDPSKNLFVMYN